MSDGQAEHVGRIPSSPKLRRLGPVNWAFAKLAARSTRAAEMHLFTTLGQRQGLFWAWSIYGGRLLRGRLPRVDTELVILRVAHLRSCEYELQHHRQMARQHGWTLTCRPRFSIGRRVPENDGPRIILSARQEALLKATDELIKDRSVSDDTWQQLATHLDRRRLIEFCLLATQYDGLAATITALNIPLDNPGAVRRRCWPARPASVSPAVSAGRKPGPPKGIGPAGAAANPTTPRRSPAQPTAPTPSSPPAGRRVVACDRNGDQPQHITGGHAANRTDKESPRIIG